MSDIILQRATAADVDAYLANDLKVIDERTYSAFTEKEEVLEEIEAGPAYLIKKDGVMVGTIAYQIKGNDTVYLSGLVIDPKYQGHGIAREALNQILKEVEFASRIEVFTHPENIRTRKLYDSFGFKEESRHENYYGDGEPRILLSRTNTS